MRGRPAWQVRRERRLKKRARQAEVKAEQIIKVNEESGDARTMPIRKKEEKAIEQIAEQTVPSEVDSFEVQRHHHGVVGEVQATDKIKVFVIDDQGLFRQGLRLLISQTDDIELIGESGFLEDIVVIIEQLAPDVVIMDIKLPALSGLCLAQRLRQRSPGISLIILTPYEDDNQIFEALKAGIAGYLSKSITPEGLVSAIRRIFNGERVVDKLLLRPSVAQRVLTQLQDVQKKGLIESLGPHEMETLGYFANGHSLKQTADTIGVSEQKIMNHMASILSKLVDSGTGPPSSTSTWWQAES